MSRQRSPHSGASTGSSEATESLGQPSTSARAISTPQTSIERLAQNLQEDDGGHPPSLDSETVLYLAYGSNLCAETFRGRRGIRPLSQVNVSVPVLRFTLRLPGLPYQEPCFANVDYRKLPEKPKLPDTPKVPPFDPPAYPRQEWDGGLVGVVYEVTKADYRQIFRTEGGGSGYKEIFVPCIPLPPQVSVPEKGPLPELPRPIIARTLYAPPVSLEYPGEPNKSPWWRKMINRPQRPDPDHAQASARYLRLITTGASEHHLPDYYQEYLQSLEPYRITSWRQQVGRVLLMLCAAPLLRSLMKISEWLADEDGRYPPLVSALLNVTFNLVWIAHDTIFKPIFGDGEATEESRGKKQRRLSIGLPLPDEESAALLPIQE